MLVDELIEILMPYKGKDKEVYCELTYDDVLITLISSYVDEDGDIILTSV